MDSLDKQLGDSEGEGGTLIDLLNDESSYKPSDYLVTNLDQNATILKCLDSLREKDKHIMILLFGLDGGEPRTLQEVSDIVDMSREMVRQIKNKTLIKLSKQKLIQVAYNEM